MKKSHFIFAVMAASGAVAGCAAPAPREEEAVVGTEATIVNLTRKPIARIVFQQCGTVPENWQPLKVPQLDSGRSVTLNLPPGCVDLNAYADDGKLAGTQRQIRTQFPFRWDLQ